MNASFFLFWERVRPAVLSFVDFMRPRLKENLPNGKRVAQLFLWSIPMFFTAVPGMKFCMFMAELSTIRVVEAFWLMSAILIGLTGLASLIVLLLGILLVSIGAAGNFLKKIWALPKKKA